VGPQAKAIVERRATGVRPCFIHGNGSGCRPYKRLLMAMTAAGAWRSRPRLQAIDVDSIFRGVCT
jgi:hypothetical protein